MIIKSSRPFTEGLFIKERLLKASEILCPNQKKLFEGISLSPNTVTSRITDLAATVEKQLFATAKDLQLLSTKAFSIALDESTDSSSTVRCTCCFYQECQLSTKCNERIPGFNTT